MHLDAISDLLHARAFALGFAAGKHLDAISDLLHARAFALGFAFGGVAFLLAAAVAVASRRRIPDVAGLAFVAAGWLGVRGAWGTTLARASVLLALGTLALGGALVVVLAHRFSVARAHPLLTTAVALVPGAVWLAAVTPLAGSDLSRAILAISTIAIGVGMRDFDAMHGARGAPWLLYAVTTAGVYLAVPDTELARVMLGVALPFVLLSIPRPLCPFGPAGSAALAGMFTWVVVVGGRGRPGSVVGGLATIGLLVAEPLGRHTIGMVTRGVRDPRDRNQDAWLSRAAVAAIAQLIIVLYASRVVAREDFAVTALLITAPLAAVAVIASPGLYPQPHSSKLKHRGRSRRPERSPSRSRS